MRGKGSGSFRCCTKRDCDGGLFAPVGLSLMVLTREAIYRCKEGFPGTLFVYFTGDLLCCLGLLPNVIDDTIANRCNKIKTVLREIRLTPSHPHDQWCELLEIVK